MDSSFGSVYLCNSLESLLNRSRKTKNIYRCKSLHGRLEKVSHVWLNSDGVEVAYRRTDLFDRRLELMQQWDDYIASLD